MCLPPPTHQEILRGVQQVGGREHIHRGYHEHRQQNHAEDDLPEGWGLPSAGNGQRLTQRSGGRAVPRGAGANGREVLLSGQKLVVIQIVRAGGLLMRVLFRFAAGNVTVRPACSLNKWVWKRKKNL